LPVPERVLSRDAAQVARDVPLDPEHADRGDQADQRGERPQGERRGREDEPADGGADEAGEPPGQAVHGEVAPTKVRRADVRDERLVRGPVEALADPEQHRGERDDQERGPGREPVAARVDEQPGDRPEERHQRERAHAAAPLDPARERQLREHDRERVDEEDRADLPLAQAGLVAREGGEEVEQRISRRNEQEVQRPEAEEGLVS
jgi:hypothetical protein